MCKPPVIVANLPNLSYAGSQENQIDQKLLADAFMEDPLFCYFIAEPKRRRDWLTTVMKVALALGQRQGVLLRCGEGRLVGFAPGAYPPSAAVELREALPLLPATLKSRMSFAKLRAALAAVREMAKNHPTDPHWYVSVLGVAGAAQGQGLGASLLGNIITRADTDAVPIYLETANRANLSYYGRFGFETISEIDLPGDSPPLWTLLRK